MKKFLSVLALVGWMPVVLLGFQQAALAACAANTANLGSATGSFSVPTAGTYRVWSRIQPDATTPGNNSFTMEIDGTACNITVGDATIPANIWTWVDYSNGSNSSKIDQTLAAGTHTYALYGRESGVKLDRIIFSADTSCLPTGTGDNCAVVTPPLDTTPPVATVTAPASGATISSTQTITATGTDAVGVTKTEIYVDNALKATANAAAVTYAFNTTLVTNGPHTIDAKAYDAAGNIGTSTPVTNVTVNNTTPADSTPPTGVAITTPTANATVSGAAVLITSTASDNVGVARVEFYMGSGTSGSNYVLLGTDNAGPTYTFSLDTTTGAYPNGVYQLISKAYDAANNSTTSATAVKITIANTAPTDTTAPTITLSPAFAGGTSVSGTLALVGNASDNVGVTKVEFYVDGALKTTDTSGPSFTYSLDTTTLSNAPHSLQAKAYDAAGNVGSSAVANVSVNNATGPIVSVVPGDCSGDGHVGQIDLSILATHYNQTVSVKNTFGDFNNDDKVDQTDLSILATNYGK